MKNLLLVLGVVLAVSGCQSTYYAAMEKVGVHKRDIMVDRIESAQESQVEAKEQFKSALDQFNFVVNQSDSDLDAKYKKLNSEYEDARDRAEEVSENIDAIEDVSEALFDEWDAEIMQFTSESLKRKSQQKRRDTEVKYKQLIRAMRQSESSMQPVLGAFKDQVLYLKHNLNAAAIDSLKGELRQIESDVGRLIKDMEKSIKQTDAFIRTLQ